MPVAAAAIGIATSLASLGVQLAMKPGPKGQTTAGLYDTPASKNVVADNTALAMAATQADVTTNAIEAIINEKQPATTLNIYTAIAVALFLGSVGLLYRHWKTPS